MNSKPSKRQKPIITRTIEADSPAAAERIAAMDALINASGLLLQNSDIEYIEGKWCTVAVNDDGHPLAEAIVTIEAEDLKQFNISHKSYTVHLIDGQLDDIPPDKSMAQQKPLKGLKIYVLMESQFVPQEIDLYEQRFAQYGAQVELVSHLWGCNSLRFHSHYDEGLVPKIRYAVVHKDIAEIDLDSPDVAAIISPIDVHQRLLFDPNIVTSKDPITAARSAPAVDLLKRALENPRIVVGAFGHGVELLTPLTNLIKDASITASPGSLCAICNAGAKWTPPINPEEWATHIVKEISTKHNQNLNLITGTSILSGGNQKFVDETARFISEINKQTKSL